MSVRPLCDAGELLKQAGMTAATYLDSAIDNIDKAFGKGYAKQNPDLVAAYMRTCALDFATACMRDGIGELADAVDRVAQAQL